VNIYLAGPMTGLPEYNFPEFARVSGILRGWGHDVVSPHEVPLPCGCKSSPPQCGADDHDWTEYLRSDLIALLAHAEGIALLDGWQKSRGALLETHVGSKLKLKIRRWADWQTV
jgi:hypothetical protein